MTQETAKHVLLTTIGAGKPDTITYQEAEYQFEFAKPAKGKFFSVLLCDALREVGKPIQKAVVLLTADAKKHANWLGTEQEQGLEKLLKERGIEIITVGIPNGNNEQEIWEIFDAIGAHIPEDATVTLDITHGFRSLPLVMLLSCAYFNTSNRFALESVYYGAYIPGQPQAHAVDLTPMLTLFEWANAVKVFRDGGDLRPMAALLEERHDTLYRTGTVKKGVTVVLKPLSKHMQTLTDALELGRLENIAEPIREARRLADEVRGDAERWAKPFVSQIDAILEELNRFQIPTDEKDVHKWLVAQFELIEWYCQKDYYMHAGLLLREWIISYVASQEPEFADRSVQDIFNDKDVREAVTKKLNEVSRVGKEISEVSRLVAELGKKLSKMSGIVKDLNGIPHFEIHPNTASSFRGIWDEIVELRNDLAHLGHRKQPDTAQTIKSKIEGLIKRLRPLKESAEKTSNSAPQAS